jgi:hypothetical protein
MKHGLSAVTGTIRFSRTWKSLTPRRNENFQLATCFQILRHFADWANNIHVRTPRKVNTDSVSPLGKTT